MFFRIYNQLKYRCLNKAITILILECFILTINGCVTTTPVSYPKEMLTQKSSTLSISYLILRDGKKVNTKDKRVVYADSIKSLIITDKDKSVSQKGKNPSTKNKAGNIDTVNNGNSDLKNLAGKSKIIPLSDVLEFFVEKEEVNASLTTLFVIGLIGVIALSTVIIKNATDKNNDPQAPPLPPPRPPDTTTYTSCPLIYSFDGEKYVFDSEPLSGVISENLARTDYTRMDFLKQSDGRFKMLVKNQPHEKEMIDELKLVTVPHSRDSYVTPNIEGEFFNYKKIIKPVSVIDENGNDVSVFFNEKDNIRWQTMMPYDTLYKGAERHSLKFRFPKPDGADSALLFVNCGSAYWGSKMIKVMLQMKGDKVTDWYGDLFNGDMEMQKLLNFIWREELFAMKVNLLEGNEYNTRAYIPAGGPLMDEDRIIRLPLQKVKGDYIEFILNPPAAFWKIDQIGIIYDYKITAKNKLKEYDAVFAEDQSGTDIRSKIDSIDKNYYAMPEYNDHAIVYFDTPPGFINNNYDIFLKTTGYYEIITDRTLKEQTELINEILNTPGKIVEYSMSVYYSMINDQ